MRLLINIIFTTFLFHYSLADETCDRKGGTCSAESRKDNKYSKENNVFLRLIQDVENVYKPCDVNKTCSCYSSVLKHDLAPFKNGITKQMINGVRERGTKYQVVNHRLYRDKSCMFPSRCSGVEYFIKRHLAELPDLEVIINCRDWPQINKNWGGSKGPVLSFSKTGDYLDIMYPTWGFWEGGPAISLYPTGLGRWDQHRVSLKKAAEEYPWKKKVAKAFFRGSRTSAERDPLILLSRRHPSLVDAQYTKNQAWKSPADTLNAEPATEVRLEDHCKYRYLFNFRGVAASFRLKHLFLCKSLVFHVGDEWKEFFYDSLRPWIHYVPVAADATAEDMEQLIQFFIEHDDLAQKIANQGYQHVWDHLKMASVHCYWKKLLKQYAKLLKFKVELDSELVEV